MAEGFGRSSAREIGSHSGKPLGFQGLWNGVVVDDLDPKKLGRVKVRIFDLHDENTPVADIPWAGACFPSAFISSDGGNKNWKSGGFFQVPPIDALVHVMFQHGDPDFPIWMGGWFPNEPCMLGREKYVSNNERKALYNGAGRPSCPTWRSLRGHVIEMDDETSEVRITSTGGHKITLSDHAGEHGNSIKLEDHAGNYIWMDTGRKYLQIRWDGDVSEHVTGNKHLKVDGNMVQQVAGTFSLSVTGKTDIFGQAPINMDSPTINLNCGIAQLDPARVLVQGDRSARDYVGSVLARLGNTIRKIVTGS
jgi:hypothetical protein